MTDVNTFSGYVGKKPLVMLVSSTTKLSSWLVTESYGYRWYDAVPIMMQEIRAAHRCEET